jgi:hypothetical protein
MADCSFTNSIKNVKGFNPNGVAAQYSADADKLNHIHVVIGQRGDTALNFDWRQYLCTSALRLALGVPVGAAWAGLIAGGTVTDESAQGLAEVIYATIGETVPDTKSLILTVLSAADTPMQLLDEIITATGLCP